MPRPHMNGAQIRAALARRAAEAAPPEPVETSPEPSPETTTPKRRPKRPSKKEQ